MKSGEYIFVGYTSQGYRLFDIAKRKIFVGRSVIFYETPYRKMKLMLMIMLVLRSILNALRRFLLMMITYLLRVKH